MSELQKVFASPDDANTVAEINSTRSALDKLISKKQTDAKKLIRDLTLRTQQLEQELNKREPTDASHKHRMDSLDRQKENVSSNITDLDRQILQLREQSEQLKRKTEELKARKRHLDEQRLEDVPRFKLYQLVSNLKWDYEHAHVKGHIDMVDFKRQVVRDVRPFDIDADKHNAFEIANTLWDLMD